MNAHLYLSESDYQALAEFRYQLRRFLHFSEQAARDAGLEPQQHSTAPLISRMVKRGLLERHRDTADLRRVLVRLTRRGEQVLGTLSVLHQTELRSSGPALVRTLTALTVTQSSAKETEA